MTTASWTLPTPFAGLFGRNRQADTDGARSLSDIEAALAEGATLLDVRTPGEFQVDPLPRAVNVPLGELGRRLGSLGAADAPIVVYCRSGSRSAMAKTLLRRAGFPKVLDLGARRNGLRLARLTAA